MTDRDLQQKRYLAAGIDIAVWIAIGIAFAVLAIISGFIVSVGPSVVNVLWAAVSLAYVLGRDLVAGDRSIGKKVQNIRVVTTTGTPITPNESIRRNAIFAIGPALSVIQALLGLVPFFGAIVGCILLPLLVLGGLISLGAAVYELLQITQDPNGIRYGDKMASTRVVR